MESILTIASTWDGEQLPPVLHGTITLRAAGPELRIEVDAPFAGDPPPAASPGPVPGLWEHEVVELFIAGPDGDYTEIELGPRGHHLVLVLDRVRHPIRVGLPLRFETGIATGRWRGTAWVPWSYLPAGPHRANAYAIAGVGPHRHYRACHAVPGPKPDFHQLDRFAPIVLPR